MQISSTPTVTLGPFVDSTGSLVTSGTPTVKLRKNGGSSTTAVNAAGSVGADGCCSFQFDSTETAAYGEVELQAKVGSSLTFFWRYPVDLPTLTDACLFSQIPYGVTATGGVTATFLPLSVANNGLPILWAGSSNQLLWNNLTNWTILYGSNTWVGPLISALPTSAHYVLAGHSDIVLAAIAAGGGGGGVTNNI